MAKQKTIKTVTVINREMIVDLIDVFESWLEMKKVTIEMIPNKERENDLSDALIYGSDYDILENQIRETLKENGIVAPEIFTTFDVDDIQNAINEAL